VISSLYHRVSTVGFGWLVFYTSEESYRLTHASLTDCVAEVPDQLMYIEGDDLILLRDLGEVLLASCEGVVGWVERSNVKFDTLAGSSSPREATESDNDTDGLPRTVLIAPSPPPDTSRPASTYEPTDRMRETSALLSGPPSESRRISGPFELDSPLPSPGIQDGQNDKDGFFVEQDDVSGDSGHGLEWGEIEDEGVEIMHQKGDSPEGLQGERDSMFSVASSEAFGGIGGLMMGGARSEHADGTDELRGETRLKRI
jgi:hypothetical protein